MSKLSLESLETRETPATFRLQIMLNPAPPAPAADDVVVDGRIITAQHADYSAVVFVGGWGASSYQYAFGGTY